MGLYVILQAVELHESYLPVFGASVTNRGHFPFLPLVDSGGDSIEVLILQEKNGLL
jgi:hypothetical protein